MSARTWREGDPEPRDVDAVVDEDGVVWRRGCECGSDFPDEDYDSPYWHQHLLTHTKGGALLGGSVGNDWDHGVWGSLPEGSVLREATAEEARTWVERWSA